MIEAPPAARCHLCDAPDPTAVEHFKRLGRVTSDCVPWPAGGELAVCLACGTIQRPITPAWEAEAKEIYDSYSIYYQSGGVEQSVFDATSGSGEVRSGRLLRRLSEEFRLPPVGRALDLGCGNGATLRELSQLMPGWSLAGTEVNLKYQHTIESIRGVEKLYARGLDEVPGVFDLVTMIHVLEHIPSPTSALLGVRDKLSPEGLLLVQVPDCRRNPFDLLVADHSTHFTAETLEGLIRRSGYEVLTVATDWVSKELTVIARPAGQSEPLKCDAADSLALATRSVEWLSEVVDAADRCSRLGKFGLFGTSIASMAVFGGLRDRVEFFIDEDANRIGRSVQGRPVFHPSQAPEGGHVYLALAPEVAQSVFRRLRNVVPNLHRPPSFSTPPSGPSGRLAG